MFSNEREFYWKLFKERERLLDGMRCQYQTPTPLSLSTPFKSLQNGLYTQTPRTHNYLQIIVCTDELTQKRNSYHLNNQHGIFSQMDIRILRAPSQ